MAEHVTELILAKRNARHLLERGPSWEARSSGP
jgi:hypothetical protein